MWRNGVMTNSVMKMASGIMKTIAINGVLLFSSMFQWLKEN
jgi:hypothetical protein